MRGRLLRARAAAVVLAAFTVGTGLPVAASAADPVVVTPDSLQGWTVTDQGSAVGTFVNGPATPPLGNGSFRQVVTNGADKQNITRTFIPTIELTSITELGYSTFVTSNNGGQAPALKLAVDSDGDGLNDDTLLFEPVYQPGGITLGSWQTWDADAGEWWAVSSGTGGPPTSTLAAFSAANPSARVFSLSVQSGGSAVAWANFDGNVDNVTLNGTTYDFESFLTVVDCDAVTNDIAAVQAAVDGAPDDYTIQLSGTCNFGAAAPHGGDIASIEAAAVVIGAPGDPAKGLTIAGAPGATVTGTGTQAAFFVAPGSEDVTIKALRFVNLGRAVVTVNSVGTTIGADTGTVPSVDGNRIVGQSSMSSAILAAANSRGFNDPNGTLTVSYGTAVSPSTRTFTGLGSNGLRDLTVAGNYITYSPPGATDGSTRDIVAVDVRQRNSGSGTGIDILRNAVGFMTSDFPSFNMNSIRVMSHSPDYMLRDVRVDGNNLGRLEELDETLLGDFNAGDVNAGGRAGIVLARVKDFAVNGNGVRARLSPTGIPMPGGAIVVGDSADGQIEGNGLIVVADPSTMDSDLGAVGVIEDLLTLFGTVATAPDTTNVAVTDNIVGTVNTDTPGLGAQRSIVLNGAKHSTVTGNVVKFSSGPAVSLGVEAVGPGSVTSPGPVQLKGSVDGGIVCGNLLEGVTDDASNVTTDAVANSAYPGSGSGNLTCTPTASASDTLLGAGEGVTVSGRVWSARPVTVVLGALSKAAVSAPNGTYSASFTDAELTALPDGTLHAVATAADDLPTSLTRSSSPVTITKDTVAPAAPAITAPADGSTVGGGTIAVTGTSEPSSLVRVLQAGLPIGTATTGPAGEWSLPLTFVDGAHTITADARDAAGNLSGEAPPVSFTMDAIAPGAPIITSPAAGALLADASVEIAGTAEPLSTVDVRKGVTSLGTVSADALGDWSLTVPLADGAHTVTARATDAVGNVSPDAVAVAFTVDTTPPGIPVITAPAPNAILKTSVVTVSGTAEPGATVELSDGVTLIDTIVAAPNGSWSKPIGFADGVHALSVVAVDAAGNTSAASAPRTLTVDTVAPILSFATADVIDQSNAQNAGATGATEAGATVGVTITDGVRVTTPRSATVDGTGDWTATGIDARTLVNGPVTYTAKATDAAGNITTVTSAATKFVASSAPFLTVANEFGYIGTDQLSGGSIIARVSYSGPDASESVTVSVTDGTTTETASPVSVAAGTSQVVLVAAGSLVDGPITVSAVSASRSAAVELVLDRVAPAAPVIDEPGLAYLSTPLFSNLAFTGTASDTLSPVRIVRAKLGPYTVNAELVTTGTTVQWRANFGTRFLVPGDYVLEVWAFDEPLNRSATATTNVSVL